MARPVFLLHRKHLSLVDFFLPDEDNTVALDTGGNRWWAGDTTTEMKRTQCNSCKSKQFLLWIEAKIDTDLHNCKLWNCQKEMRVMLLFPFPFHNYTHDLENDMLYLLILPSLLPDNLPLWADWKYKQKKTTIKLVQDDVDVERFDRIKCKTQGM